MVAEMPAPNPAAPEEVVVVEHPVGPRHREVLVLLAREMLGEIIMVVVQTMVVAVEVEPARLVVLEQTQLVAMVVLV